MSKRPTPKQQKSKSNTKKRYASYALKQKTKLINRVNLVTCSQCNSPVPAHTACANCGKYRDRTVINKEQENITKIKA